MAKIFETLCKKRHYVKPFMLYKKKIIMEHELQFKMKLLKIWIVNSPDFHGNRFILDRWVVFSPCAPLQAVFQGSDECHSDLLVHIGWTVSQCCYEGDYSSSQTDQRPGMQDDIHHYQHLLYWKALHFDHLLFWSPGKHHLGKIGFVNN